MEALPEEGQVHRGMITRIKPPTLFRASTSTQWASVNVRGGRVSLLI